MDTYKLKWTKVQMGIFRLLCIKSGQNLNMRAISKYLKISPTAVSKSLRNLEKEGLIVIEKKGAANELSIRFDRNNPNAIDMKRAENLKMIYESKLPNFLSEAFPGCAIILFGSYSFGEDVWITGEKGHKSDIDIAVIGSREKEVDLSKFEKFLEKSIVINFYPSFKGIHENLKNNILSGILLKGRVEL
jgi:DNA-binding Lrp family transcriptional regulator